MWGWCSLFSIIICALLIIKCYDLGNPYYFVADSQKFFGVITSITLFMFFKNLHFKNKFINTVSSTILGVLLIHANSDTMIKWLWVDTFKNTSYVDCVYCIPHAILSVMTIFIICCLIDLFRQKLIEKPFFKLIDNKLLNRDNCKILLMLNNLIGEEKIAMKLNDKELCFAKIRETARVPEKRDEDAGFDMYADFAEDFLVIGAGETRAVPTGIAVAFSKKYYAQIEERSSMAKLGIKKSGGVMDSGYRGEYFIMTYNTNKKPFIISKISIEDLDDEFEINGVKYKKEEAIIYPYTKAICQVVMQEIPVLDVQEISYEELRSISSERGEGRFGSSKK